MTFREQYAGKAGEYATSILHEAPSQSILGLVIVGVFSLLVLSNRKANINNTTAAQEQHPEGFASVQSKLFFSWANPLLETGYTKGIDAEDVWDLPDKDATTNAYATYCAKDNETGLRTPASIWHGLLRAFGADYLWAGLFKIAADFLSIAQPQAFRILISYILLHHAEHDQSKAYGLALGSSIFILHILQAICHTQYEFLVMRTALRSRSALSMIIYEKITKLSPTARSSNPSGAIMGYFAVDIDRLTDIFSYGHKLWSTPLTIGLALYSLYQLIGASAFVGFAATLAVIYLNSFVASRLQKIGTQQRRNRDAKARKLTEMLLHIKNLKLLGWMSIFMDIFEAIRVNQELPTLKRQSISLAMANVVWNTGSFMISFLSLTTYILAHKNDFKPEIIFPALTLLQLLNQPLTGLPYVISAVLNAIDSAKRIENFQQEDEIQSNAVDWKHLSSKNSQPLTIRNVSFAWGDSTQPNITISDLCLNRDTLCCVIGSIGSGKSTLLEAILGGVTKIQGTIQIRGSVAYVAQKPWLFNGSIKDNILFGHELHQLFYDTVLDACALKDDLITLKDGDETQVGGQGMNLSGGQKARISLARAVYARADIYLLDDVLSAVDMHVKGHLMVNVLGPHGLLRKTTRILATNALTVMDESGHIVMLDNGSVVGSSSLANAQIGQGPIACFLEAHYGSDQLQDAGRKGSSRSFAIDLDGIPPAKLAKLQQERKKYRSDKSQTSTKSGPLVVADRASDERKWRLYEKYIRAGGFSSILLFVGALSAHRLWAAGTDIWVKFWLEDNTKVDETHHKFLYIVIYLGFGLGSAVFSGIQMYFLLVRCSYQASKHLHAKMTHSVFHSPMAFFETTLFGEIVTHFTSDMYRVDDRIARFFNSMLSPRIRSGMMLLIMAWTIPRIILFVIPLSFFYLRVQNYFVNTSRALSKLNSQSSSLAYTHLQSVYSGISTIRAFNHLDRFQYEMEQHIDKNLKVQFANKTVELWLHIRLEIIGAIITAAISFLAIFAAHSSLGISPAMVGVVLVNAQRLTSILGIQVQSVVYLEEHLNSLERVLDYIELPPEGCAVQPIDVSPAWPKHGVIRFHNFSTRYRKELPETLRNVNFTVRGGEKIGVVGRTGAGKSSLVLSLFRILEATQGEIEIDGIAISLIPLQTLRSRVSCIPQEASLFIGTIRSNLDPMSIHSNQEIWNVLVHVNLSTRIAGLPDNIATQVEESGSNFSVGERQLLCLARALLRKTSILVLDEATSSIDPETDRVVQNMLNGKVLEKQTVITIAHRIETVLGCDRILVLERGEVAEFGPPADLIAKGGTFYSLVMEAGAGP